MKLASSAQEILIVGIATDRVLVSNSTHSSTAGLAATRPSFDDTVAIELWERSCAR